MVIWSPTQNLGPIGSAVLTFIGHKQTDRQTSQIYKKMCTSYPPLLKNIFLLYIGWWINKDTFRITCFRLFTRCILNNLSIFFWRESKWSDLIMNMNGSNFRGFLTYNVQKTWNLISSSDDNYRILSEKQSFFWKVNMIHNFYICPTPCV